MIIQHYQKLFLLTCLIFPVCITTADELRIPVGQQAQDQVAVDMPLKGMSKERVRSLFGTPLEEVAPKGNPPISRWKYEQFTVYFDRDTVIHSVRNFQPKTTSPENSEPGS